MSMSEAANTPCSAKARAASSTSFSRVFDASSGIPANPTSSLPTPTGARIRARGSGMRADRFELVEELESEHSGPHVDGEALDLADRRGPAVRVLATPAE